MKDEVEERLFARRHDLFTDLSLIFMDTTTLSFHGAGGESLGAHGHSRDHRPELKHMVLAVVLDGEGRPVCTEMLAGNTADMRVLLPVVDRLQEATIEKDGKRVITRTHVAGQVGRVFQAAGVALPANWRERPA